MPDEESPSPCPDMLAAAVAGSVCGTLAFCSVIFGIITFFMWRRMKKTRLEYFVSNRNGLHRQHSMAPSVEAGVHNSAYIGDSAETKDVIMMMATKKKEEERKHSSSRRRVIPSMYKNLDCVDVTLIGKEVSGLGFDIHGNPRDGISISNIAERGAARETNQIKVGDKIMSLTISFDNMVYEDALTLLSYASPYPITMQLGRKRKDKNKENGTLKSMNTSRKKQTTSDNDSGTASDVKSPDLSTRSPDLSTKSHEISTISHDVSMKPHDLSGSPADDEDCDNEMSFDLNDDEVSIDMPHFGAEQHEDTDDDTQRRAPTYLPKTIKDLVESKRSGREAVEAIEGHTKEQILSPSNLGGSEDAELSLGAQRALDFILNQPSGDVGVTS